MIASTFSLYLLHNSDADCGIFIVIMVNKHCCYGTCTSESRYAGRKESMQGVSFIPLPKPTSQPDKCKKWVTACYRSDFDVQHVNKDTYICTKHFVGGNGPTDDHQDPIPAGYSHE